MRIERRLSDAVKTKISEAMKGKEKSASTKAKISSSMKEYWSRIPYENKEINNEVNV